MKRYMAAIACILVMAMLAGCRSGDDQPNVTDNSVQTGQTQQTEGQETSATTEGAGTTEDTGTTEGTGTAETTETTEDAGTAQDGENTVEQETAGNTENTGNTGSTEATVDPNAAVRQGILVATKFGNLYYQEQWEGLMHAVVEESGNVITVTFEADVNGVRYPLFRVVIGESDGDPVGKVTDSQGTRRAVYVYMEDFGDISGLTEGEQNRLFAMQEDINFVIESLD